MCVCMCVCVCVCLLSSEATVYFTTMSACVCNTRRALVWSFHRLSLSAPRSTQHEKNRQVTPRSLLVVFINFVLQMQPNTAVVRNPRGALPSECALFLATLHLFFRQCSARKNQQNTDSRSPFSVRLTGV